MITEDNSYNVEDDDIFFTSDWYDIGILKNVQMVKYDNSLFGECEELRPVCEFDEKNANWKDIIYDVQHFTPDWLLKQYRR